MNHDLIEGPKGHVCELPARDGCHDNIVYLAKGKLQRKLFIELSLKDHEMVVYL